jgi:hypothetical protein
VCLSKQHPVRYAKGRAKLDGVYVAEVTSDTAGKYRWFTPRKLYPKGAPQEFRCSKSNEDATYPESAAEKTPPRSDQTGATFFHQKQKGKDF